MEGLDVRLYSRNESGDLDLQTIVTASYFDGNIPIPGDTIAVSVGDFDFTAYRVLDRHFVARNASDRGWLLLVEVHRDDSRLKAMSTLWAEDTKFFDELPDDTSAEYKEESAQPSTETRDDLDRTNRDPEYWTFERKELLRKEREARLAAMKAGEAKDSR